MRVSGKVACLSPGCAACGCCQRVCPRDAIHIYRGVEARIDRERCAGCGLCARACPASFLSLVERRAV